ncbi:MAG: universal stress protein [Chloroflexi bacterium]|nr:universal stress protein [Chloroflexota bacterium]
MLEKILVCLDGSNAAEQILPYLVTEARRLRSRVVLLRVISLPETMVAVNIPGSPGIPVRTEGTIQRAITEEAEANDYLKRTAESLQKDGVDVDYAVVTGTAGESIISYAQNNSCTVIAIATHGHGGFRRFALGSTADYVVHHSQIPVLTIRAST